MRFRQEGVGYLGQRTSRVNDCKAIGGSVGEKDLRRVGRVRAMRFLLASIGLQTTALLVTGSFVLGAARPDVHQLAAPPHQTEAPPEEAERESLRGVSG